MYQVKKDDIWKIYEKLKKNKKWKEKKKIKENRQSVECL